MFDCLRPVRLLFVDTGAVTISKAPVRPLPGRWSLEKLLPVSLFVRVCDSAPAGTRDALHREENSVTLRLQPAGGGGGAEQLAGLATTATGISGRALLSQLGGAAPAPAPAQETVRNQTTDTLLSASIQIMVPEIY